MRKEKREVSGMRRYYGRTKQNEKKKKLKKGWVEERQKDLRAFVCIKYIFEN